MLEEKEIEPSRSTIRKKIYFELFAFGLRFGVGNGR